MAAADILKTRKLPYIGNGSTDLDQILHGDPVRPC